MTTLFKPRPLVLFFLVIVLFAGLSFTYAPRAGEYRASVLTMGLGYTAKAMCSCVFVSEQGEEQCRVYASIKQVSPTLTVDAGTKSVTSRWMLWAAQATYLGPELGCVLE